MMLPAGADLDGSRRCDERLPRFPQYSRAPSRFPGESPRTGERGSGIHPVVRSRHYYDKYSQWNSRWGVSDLQAPWFRPWLRSLPHERWLFLVAPTLLTLLAWGFVLRRRAQGRWRQPQNSAWLVLIPALVGAFFWLVTAPNPRFATSTFWTIAATSCGLCCLPLD